MSNGANGVHLQLREALENYIKSQYFGKSPILLSAAQNKLNQEGVLYQKPYVESSPAYKSTTNGIQLSPKLPDWLKDYFKALSDANLGVYPSPFCHQISALEAAFEGQDLFVSTGTGSGKTECFMWPLMAKLASEARNSPDSWAMRGVRTIIMYPMNALVSDQISRLRRLIGDPDHRFINIFRTACGNNSRRPQFGMYTGRTPYAGKEPRRSEDRSLAATYSRMVNPENDEEKAFLEKLIKDGKLPAKENFDEFLEKLYNGKHIPNDEDAELVTRFEMQQFCPDILITNYSMLEYMLLRPREHKIWSDKEIHLFIPSAGYRLPERQGQNKISPCYLDVQSGFIDFSDDSLDGKQGIRKLYYSGFTAKARPDILTFSTCPHCRHELSKMQLTSFNTRGNQSFFNLIKAQFQAQPAVPGKTGDPDRLPNEGRKVLLFSDSRQRAAKLARDMSDASDMTAARQLAVLAIDRMEHEVAEQSMNYFYDYFAMVAVEHHVQIFHDSETEKQRERLIEHGTQALKNYTRAKKRGQQYTPRFTIDNAPTQMKEQLIRFYCGGYNTLVDSALSWIEPTDAAKWDTLDALEEAGIEVSEEEFMEFFNAWILSTCDTSVILGHTIPDVIREKVRPNYVGYGIDKNKKFSTDIREIMGWSDNDSVAAKWSQILRETFMDEGSSSNGKYYIDLSRIKPRFDLEHTWFRCERCSELTPYLLKGKCPSCQCEKIHPMTTEEIDALDFWRKPIEDALQGDTIRVIDTEEHTAQLSHKDQRDELWSRTEQYELRFQDFLQNGEAPVDILSSTTTMEVGIDIGSLVAVGLRNIPPMRENYQQRAGRAGRRGSSLSTIVTFCEDGPHDSLYFSNPVPMFRGDPRKPWIDISSEKITQRHLGMVALQTYLREKSNSLDAIPAIEFLDEHLQPFSRFLEIFEISKDDILVPVGSKGALGSYKDELEKSLSALKQKRDDHPELFETDDSSDSGKKSLLDALYEEGVIPTYSFPKNVVSTYISDVSGKVKYQVERGLDVAIGEYAPGRAIVVDKTTYQIGGLYYPGGERSERTAASPAKAFIQDASYRKSIRTCSQCGWFGLEEDNPDTCPFCGNKALTNMLPMLRPWGFAPRNATSIETAQLNEEYSATQQPLYSTLPDADDVTAVNGCANIRMAVRPNQRIIMLNNGVSGKGFTICCDCGAAMPGDDPAVLKDVLRPYRSKFIKTRCKHSDTINVNLGYDFVTDMLVLEFALDRQQIDINPTRNSWLNRAGQSLAEGLRLAACQELDIEFTELVTGFRVRQNRNGDFVDIYLYDSLSSGAGYAVSIESSIRQLLTKTRELLEGCTCDSACHRCLKHYRNQYIHSVLNRKAALDLLNWGETGARVSAVPYEKQQYLLKSLEQILRISGIHIDVNHESVWAEGRYSKKKVVVYPAMWTKPIEENTIFVSDAHLKYAKPYALKTILDSL